MKTEEISNFFGSDAKLAAAIGTSPSAVNQWGEFVPTLRRPQIREAIRDKIIKMMDFYNSLLQTVEISKN